MSLLHLLYWHVDSLPLHHLGIPYTHTHTHAYTNTQKTVTLLYSRNEHNTVNQLLQEKKKEREEYTSWRVQPKTG